MIRTNDIVEELEQCTNEQVETVLRRLIIKSLSPLQRKVYDFILSQYPEAVSTTEIAGHIQRKINHVGNIVKFLHNAGLLIKDGCIHNHVVEWTYGIYPGNWIDWEKA